MLSKHQENILYTMQWLVKNPGKTMVLCSPSREQTEATVAEVKRVLSEVGKELISEPCVIDGKETEDVRLRLSNEA